MNGAELKDCDVAIVGYGPVGQALAAMLGQAGHRVTVFERWPALYPLPRACVVDHEAMRILQSIAVAEPFARLTVPTRGEYVWLNARGQTLYHFRYPRDGASGWPSRSLMYQPDLEAQLDARVKALHAVDVHQGFEVVATQGHDDGARLTVERQAVDGDGHLKATGERLDIRARWVVGCDGAGSFVRRACGLPWVDLGFRADWLVVDVLPNDPARELDMPEAGQICDPARPMTVMRRMGLRHVRWEMMLLPGETAADICRPERVWPMIQRWIAPHQGRIERAAVYTFRSGVAGRWRQGRHVLAGDAAHLMPPFLGQGLCSGLRDARALFWRLDDVLAGRSSEAVLDTYEIERSTHVQAVIERAVALGRVVCITDPAEAARRDDAILTGSAPPLPPFPSLHAGLLHSLAADPVAGQLAPQPRVSHKGRSGRLDDVVGAGWHLWIDDERAEVEWQPEAADFSTSIGLRVVRLRAAGGAPHDAALDLDHLACTWLRDNGIVAALVRPDFYAFGGVASPSAVGALLSDLQHQLRPHLKAIP
jgi:2-polyprenyl-6-methoxyphenol hydroxylase-like FAD-dependent oxidoreductase